jgi:hypothetical protein
MAVEWSEVFSEIPELAEAVRANGKHVPCPVHGGKDGFRLFENWRKTGGGICNTCGDFPSGWDILRWLNRDMPARFKRQGSDGFAKHMPSPVSHDFPVVDYEGRKKRNMAMWESSIELSACLSYFKGRGIPLDMLEEHLSAQIKSSLRENLCPYYDESGMSMGKYMTILAPVMAGREMVAIHRTYTLDKGKAPVPSPKKITPPSRSLSGVSLVIPLFPQGHEEYLLLAEGIETAIAVAIVTGMPCQATTSATFLKNARSRKKIMIFADGDKVGVEAAKICRSRNKGALIFKAPDGKDWLDVFLEEDQDREKTVAIMKKNVI